jgi:hypothetical protein
LVELEASLAPAEAEVGAEAKADQNMRIPQRKKMETFYTPRTMLYLGRKGEYFEKLS